MVGASYRAMSYTATYKDEAVYYLTNDLKQLFVKYKDGEVKGYVRLVDPIGRPYYASYLYAKVELPTTDISEPLSFWEVQDRLGITHSQTKNDK